MKQPFDHAVREHGDVVLRVCRAVLGHHTAADDAWSETFLSAMRAWRICRTTRTCAPGW